MASIAEILSNPARFTPTQVLKGLASDGIAKGLGGDALVNYISDAMNGVGYTMSKRAVRGWASQNLPSNQAFLFQKTKQAKRTGERYIKPEPIWAQQRAKRAGATRKPSQSAATRKQLFQGAMNLDDLRAALAYRPEPRARKPKAARAPAMPLMQRLQNRWGSAPVPVQAFEVGAPIRRRSPRRRYNVGSEVALNPVMGNPAFDFSLQTMSTRAMDSLQTGGGAVAGIGAAKLLNDKVLSHLFKTPEGQEPSFWQRLAAGAGTLVVLPTLIRAFIPNQFGEKLATGAEVGSALYVIGGIQYQGKKVLPIGNMIGADEVIVETTVAGEEVIVEGYDRSPEQVESCDRTPDRTDADVTMEDGVEMEVGAEEEVVIEG